MTGRQDNIGNRTTATHNGNTATYTANNLNQYSQRTVPGFFDVSGTATAGTTVTVTKPGGPTDTAARHGNYFFDPYSFSNTAGAVYATLTIFDGTAGSPLPGFVAKTPEIFGYDDDGNLTSDGRWTYTYDAENRPITAETTAAAVTAGIARQKLTLGQKKGVTT